jgi:hypothetical protein
MGHAYYYYNTLWFSGKQFTNKGLLQLGYALRLGKVSVHVGLLGAALEVFALDEMLNSPLDHLGVGPEEVELLEHFEDELLVGQLKEAQ